MNAVAHAMTSHATSSFEHTDFLQAAGWGNAEVIPMGADAGYRCYFQLKMKGQRALLMDMSRAGYEAGLKAYLDICDYLGGIGLEVPEIYYHDIDMGLAVIEDLGKDSFGDVLRKGHEKEELYRRGTEILIRIKDQAKDNVLSLTSYNDCIIRERLAQFVEFYVPSVTSLSPDKELHESYQQMWQQVEHNLPPAVNTFCHADYHLENLIWCPDREEGYGLIDFQDAFWGPQPYDLLNLLEDARTSVPDEIKNKMKALYCEGMSAEERQVFEDWYVVLSAHFHSRVLGLFLKLHKERGMEQYLPHVPRLQNYIKGNLDNPVLAPLKKWLEDHQVSLDAAPA